MSVAVHVMIVSPSGNTWGASLVIVGESSIISSTDANPTSTKLIVSTASMIMFWGMLNSGAEVSITEIVWVTFEELPDASVAVHVTKVSPNS